MYEQYLRDPASVGEEWRQLFDNGKLAELPVIPTNREEVVAEGGMRDAGSAPAPTPPASRVPLPGLTPLTGPAARLAQNMTDSLSVPTATSFREITVDVLDARRRELNAQLAAAGKKISYTHLIGYAIARAARELPVMTHAFQDVDGKPHRFDPHAVNLGLAVDVEKKDGSHALVVPVIKHAEAMDFAAFHATYEPLVEKARTNTLLPDDLAAAMALVKAIRNFGHLAARLDPLGSDPPGGPALDPGPLGLTPEIMARVPADLLRIYVPGRTLADAYPKLQETYCGTIAYEVEHIGSHQERVWLRQVIESGDHKKPLTPEMKRKLLARLTAVETLERFLHKAYLGQKRFSIEGLDTLVPMLDQTIELAGTSGARRVVLGMAHRGRLNVLAHIVGLPYETIFAEFEGGRHVEGTLTPEGGTGDVKNHHGADGVYQTAAGKPVNITLTPNPSHLEAVNPVVEGRARANQTNRRGKDAIHDGTVALPLLIHGDASFAAQGVVAETFNLARLKGYSTGGTIHLIANNQLGFTTDPREARSTDYASDLAKGSDAPLIHQNADDPEACLAAARLAMMYRDKFHGDVVLDVVGYRRHGHNEGDEPAYTQPVMYERIKQTPTVRQRYAEQPAREGVLDAAAAAAEAAQVYQRLTDIQQSLKANLREAGAGEEPQRISGAYSPTLEPETAVSTSLLTTLNEPLLQLPVAFTVIPTPQR